MKRFDKGQKKLLTLLVILIIMGMAVVAVSLITELQEYTKFALWGYVFISVILFICAFAISKKLFHDAGVMESQFELIHGKEEGEEYGFTFNKNAPLDVYIRKKDE